MGKTVIMDGNEAAAYISYAFTEVAGIFPITPSSPMAEHVDSWATMGKKNLFGQEVRVVEMQSEGGAAGTVHGSLQAGALTTTYTASQGLLLMIPNMYKIAGELLPGVFHVSARTLSAHALSIFGDHSDVMSVRGTGFALLASSSVQEAMDMGAAAHLSAISCRVPFLHFFDGFRTSHEIQKIEAIDYEELRPLLDEKALRAFRKNALNPEHPVTRGTTVNPDIFFQCKEASNPEIMAVPETVEKYFDRLFELTKRRYHLFDYYGAADADKVIILMGSAADTARETVDFLNKKGMKTGVINVHLYRPFSAAHFIGALPKSVKKIAVLDRVKEVGALGDPLYTDVCTALSENGLDIPTFAGRYGLSSKDTVPDQLIAVFENLDRKDPKNHFTIGINDDVTFTSLPDPVLKYETQERGFGGIFWGVGSDGTVGANKNSVKIIGQTTHMHCQAYFVYDSKKSGGLTQSHLRFSEDEIHSPYLVQQADFVACHVTSYLDKYDLLENIKEGGTFFLNCPWSSSEIEDKLPGRIKRALFEKKIKFYVIDASNLAAKAGLKGRTNTILQAAFFSLSGVIPMDVAVTKMKEAIHKTYFISKGAEVVEKNQNAIMKGIEGIRKVEIPGSWKDAPQDNKESDAPDFIKEVVNPMNSQKGDALPVSVFRKYRLQDGTWPLGTTKYEKRGMAATVPMWDVDKCVGCNLCSFVCPHAAIRPVLLDEEELLKAPSGFDAKHAPGRLSGKYKLRIQVSPYDCTGCESCVNLCPVPGKALVMKPLEEMTKEASNWDYAEEFVSIKEDAFSDKNVRDSQYAKPYFEFSGACAGCGETPYIKLVTQLFGDRMYIANASGCSSAYGGSTPSTPYTTDRKGFGPAWAMSLFEDNAEYAYGFLLGQDTVRNELKENIRQLKNKKIAKDEAGAFLEGFSDANISKDTSIALLKAIENINEPEAEFIRQHREFLRTKSIWAFGGDGWAYDIGYGGLDHVLASGANINILVLDTEVYSNTGGQSSKATGMGAVAKFSSGGKRTKKKNLGMMAMSYGYVYVAQVAMGADPAQTLTAIREAESYDGPSIVICYCPCIEHHMKMPMGRSQEEEKRAVEAGYWHLYRYDPRLAEEGKNPFMLDSKEPIGSYSEFLQGENRYASLLSVNVPEDVAKDLLKKSEADARQKYEKYREMADCRE